MSVQQDGKTVAEGQKNDETADRMHLSIMFNAKVDQSSKFELCYWSYKYTNIPAGWLQYSYQIYGWQHELAE